MKTVKITLTGKKKPIHDGVGGVHSDGAIVELPDAIADQFVAIKVAVFVGDMSSIAAIAANKERADESRIAQIKARASRAMQIHDALPADVRQAVHEDGDEVTERYLAGIDDADASVAEPIKRPRGRPRKNPL
jgi:hypothetical protein